MLQAPKELVEVMTFLRFPQYLKTLNASHEGQAGVWDKQVMRSVLGYYKNQAANAAAFPVGDEWFDTGDLGYICPAVQGSRMAGQVS